MRSDRHEDPRATVSRNFLALGAGETLGRLFSFAAVAYVTRTVSPEAWGVIALAAGVTLYLGKVADFAIETVGTDEVSTGRHEIGVLVSSLLTTRLAITAVLVLVGLGLALVSLRGLDRLAFAAYFLTLIPLAASTRWVHVGLEAAGPVGLWRAVGEGIALVGAVLLIHDSADAWKLPVAVLVGDGVSVTVLWWLLRRKGYRIGFRWDPGISLPIFRRALPVMSQIILGLAIYNSDLVFLRLLRSSSDVGYYAAAYALISFLNNVSVAYGLSVLPTLSRLRHRSPEQGALYHTVLLRAFAATLPIVVGGALVAPALMAAVYGAPYARSGILLQILLLTTPFSTARVVSFCALVPHQGKFQVLRATAVAALGNTVLNVILVTAYGPEGAAWSSVATETLLAVILLRYGAIAGFSLPSAVRLWRPVVACGAMGAVVWLLGGAPLAVQVAAGAIGYLAALVAVGVLRLRGGILDVRL